MAQSPEASPRQYLLRPLEQCVFNYPEQHEERFIRYCRLRGMMPRSGARRVLEIGPGEGMLAISEVKTFEQKTQPEGPPFGGLHPPLPE